MVASRARFLQCEPSKATGQKELGYNALNVRIDRCTPAPADVILRPSEDASDGLEALASLVDQKETDDGPAGRAQDNAAAVSG